MIYTAIRDYMGNVINSIQDTLLEIRDKLKEAVTEDASRVFGFLDGPGNVDHNTAVFRIWHNGSAYLHRWRDGVSVHKFFSSRH